MYRHNGLTGRSERVEDSFHRQPTSFAGNSRPASGGLNAPLRQSPPPAQSRASGGMGLQNLLPFKLGELESEDIILLLVLYLLYRESGDRELLIIMGAMLFL